MFKWIAVLAAVLSVGTASAADMQAGYVNALTPAEQLLASDMAHWRGVSQLCHVSDGTNLNQAYWNPRLAAVPTAKKSSFSNAVKAQTQVFVDQNIGPDVALKCDDWMDDVRSDWDAADPISDAPPRGPVCFDEPTGLWRCDGTGEMDPLAGFDALTAGY